MLRNSRFLAAALLATATFAFSIDAGAFVPSHPITITSGTPVPGQPISVDGSCGSQGTTDVSAFNLLTGRRSGIVSVTTAVNGSFTATVGADWASDPGWFQIVADCPDDANGQVSASSVFAHTDGLQIQTITVTPNTDEGGYTISGNCPYDFVNYEIFSSDMGGIGGGSPYVESDGSWTDYANTVPADGVIYGNCFDEAGFGSLLYEWPRTTTPGTTTTLANQPTTTTQSTTSPTTRRTQLTTSPAARPVQAAPAYTG